MPSNSKPSKSVGALRASCSCTSTPLIRSGVVVCASCSAPIYASDARRMAGFSQRDGERPVGCNRGRFLDIWKRAFEARDPGATKDGRARLLTEEAYSAFAKVTAAPPSATTLRGPTTRTREDEAIDDLGLERRAS